MHPALDTNAQERMLSQTILLTALQQISAATQSTTSYIQADTHAVTLLMQTSAPENGNPNPSSGELQTMHGCEEGYITDTDLCSRVFDKAAEYGW